MSIQTARRGGDGHREHTPSSSSAVSSSPSPSAPSLQPRRTRAFGYGLFQPAKLAPEFMQRPYIFTGYRVGFTFSMCFRSVFQIHNETGNIWTHLLGFGLFAHLFVRTQALLAATDSATNGASSTAVDRACFWCFLGAAQVCMLCSAYYHCVGCVSEGVHRCTLNLDLSGVVVLIAGSFVPGLRFGFYCHPLAQAVYMALIVAMAAGFLMVLLVPQGKRLRTPVLIGMVVFGLLPAVHWCLITPRAHVDRFAGRLLAMFLLYGLGVTLWSSKYVVRRQRETERDRERERERERQRETERDRERQRETKRDKERQRETKRDKERLHPPRE